jgi:hypothetical protein
MMPSRFVLELGDEVRLDKHIGLGGQRNGVIAALGRSDRFCKDCQPCERAAKAQHTASPRGRRMSRRSSFRRLTRARLVSSEVNCRVGWRARDRAGRT